MKKDDIKKDLERARKRAAELKDDALTTQLKELEDEVVKIEADHPRLTAIVGEVSTLLARMGI